ncbi:MAG TPA: Wzz/FepE/Etk N-terminal domain-containing protein [Gaiellaceae bacterium]|nr:Wzz/FepE/Etk N-terminal domain-containing protein [Gaiellaceae bacterium]
MSFDPEAEQEVDFGKYARLLGARWWLLAAGLVFGAIVGYAVALGGKQVYNASATIYLGQPYTASGNVALQSLQTNPSTVGTIAHSQAVDGQVAGACKTRVGVFRSGISTKPIAGNLSKNGQNPLVSLSVQTANRKIAACVANALAKEVITRISGYANAKIASFRSEISDDEKAISTIETGISSPGVATTDKLLLQVQLRTLQLDLTSAGQLLHQATAVEKPAIVTPASPARVTARSRRNSVAVAGLIGLILGGLAALLWDPVAAAVARRRTV